MSRLSLTVAFAVAALGAAAGAQQTQTPQQQQPVIRSGTDTVRVFVTVTDRDGRLVTNLTEDKFAVRDEGKPQPITIFDNSPKPIELIVMLDVSGSMDGNMPLLRAGARPLFARMGPEDVAKIGTFGREVIISPAFTRDANELDKALPAGIEDDAPTPLWRAMSEAVAAFDPPSDRRRVVVVLSDGGDSGPAMTRRYVSQGEAIDRARAADVMVYGIGLRGGAGRRGPIGMGRGGLAAAMQANEPDPGLARTALETGGGYTDVRPSQDLGAVFAAIVDELHSQYLLGFAPPKRDGKKHDLDVRVSEGGLEPRARKSYVAPKGS
jgi:VWFA-related protein